jgi:DNA-binding LacI/PurR family transcriptional regulator
MGLQAAATLIDGAVRPGTRQVQVKVECTLVERESVGPPRQRAQR